MLNVLSAISMTFRKQILMSCLFLPCLQELEQTLHGDRSVNIAKTFKVIGTLYMIDNPPKPQEAKEYLLRA